MLKMERLRVFEAFLLSFSFHYHMPPQQRRPSPTSNPGTPSPRRSSTSARRWKQQMLFYGNLRGAETSSMATPSPRNKALIMPLLRNPLFPGVGGIEAVVFPLGRYPLRFSWMLGGIGKIRSDRWTCCHENPWNTHDKCMIARAFG